MLFFFFKQKTAYEWRISDWSSDVCSSDLPIARRGRVERAIPIGDRGAAHPRRRRVGLGLAAFAQHFDAILLAVRFGPGGEIESGDGARRPLVPVDGTDAVEPSSCGAPRRNLVDTARAACRAPGGNVM